jgi:hypothetical protein
LVSSFIAQVLSSLPGIVCLTQGYFITTKTQHDHGHGAPAATAIDTAIDTATATVTAAQRRLPRHPWRRQQLLP